MCACANRRELRDLGSATEPSAVPTSSSPRGRGGVYGCPVSWRAPHPEGPPNLGHQWNVSFVSTTLQRKKSRKRRVSIHHPIHTRSRGYRIETHHSTKLALRMFPPMPSGIRVRERGFEPSSDTIWVASPQQVPEPGSPRGGGGDGGTTTAGREKRHNNVWIVKVERRVCVW